MKHIRIFETVDAFNAAKDSLAKPNIGLITETGKPYAISGGSEPEPTYEYVDLGLQSGTLWATCNVGANSPTEYGKYFAWGETDGYYDDEEHDFSWSTYEYSNEYGTEITKYNPQDGLIDLELNDDVAHVNMGGDWKMPNKVQMEELFNETNHAWVEDYQGTGINGRVFTSKTNGNTMFIPASGLRWDNSVVDQGLSAVLWSSTLHDDVYGFSVDLSSDNLGVTDGVRCYGSCVRGVITPAE